MARKRLISPEFFQHAELYDAELRSGLPLRLAFAGLWTATDRRGLFSWKPRELKLAALPYDSVDFSAVLDALERAGFVKRYVVDGKQFGMIPSFHRWQTFHKHEQPSDIPEPSNGCREPSNGGAEPALNSLGGSSGLPITGTVAVTVTGSSTGTIAVAGTVEPPAASTADAEATDNSSDPVEAFLLHYDFAEYEADVEGAIRAARQPLAVMGILRRHLEGMDEPQSMPRVVGCAVQEYMASGEPPLKSNFFAGIVRKVRTRREENDNRRRNSAEGQRIDAEKAGQRTRDLEAQKAEAAMERFAIDEPDRYAALRKLAEDSIPKSFTLGRAEAVHGKLLTLVRAEFAHAGESP